MADLAAFLAGGSATEILVPFKGKRLAATQEGST
jgi:hypothetical protein